MTPMAIQFTRIIAAVDGSEDAGRAAAAAAALAKEMNCPLTLLHVFPAPAAEEFINIDSISGALAGSRAQLSPERMEAAGREVGAKVFASARQAIGDSTLQIEEKVVSGHVVPEIIRYVQGAGPAILVVGRRGLGRVGEFLLGSVSDKLIRQAHVPVMVV
jgi:nucleotide-binding universal stress UspA family protein